MKPSGTGAGSVTTLRSGLIMGVIVTIAASAALIATDALAGKKLKTKSATVEIPSGEPGSVTATCKKKQKAVSGGFESEEFDPGAMDNSVIFPFTSVREGKRGWHSAGVNFGDPNPFTSHAYCRKQKKLKVASAEVEAPPVPASGVPVEVSATATCPKGTKALSGGFDNPDAHLDPGDATLVLAKLSRKRGGRKWEVRGGNLGNDEGTLTAQVNCHKGKKPKPKEASVALDGDPTIDATEVTAQCPKKKRVVSGGFESDVPVTLNGPLFTASKRVGKRGWHVAAAAGVDAEITSYAYCEKTKKKKR